MFIKYGDKIIKIKLSPSPYSLCLLFSTIKNIKAKDMLYEKCFYKERSKVDVLFEK